MPFIPASPASLLAFEAILLFVVAALLWAVQRTTGSAKATGAAALLLAAWLGGLAALISSGALADLPLRGLPLFFAPVVLVWGAAALSPLGRRIAEALPIAALVGFQGFRLPLELVLHAWFTQGTIPETMTWSGQNWDIASGVVALICAPLAAKHRAAAVVANAVGLALLLNVIRVALLSAPLPFGWHTQPPLLLAFHLPYAFIGPVCVGGALFGHLVLTRALLQRRTGRGGPQIAARGATA